MPDKETKIEPGHIGDAVGGPLSMLTTINRLLDRARRRGEAITLTPVPAASGGGWVASMGAAKTREYDDASDAVSGLDKITAG